MELTPPIATLRARLAERLRQLIGNPTIEEKELAAFDIVMSRRDVLKSGGASLAVASLISAGVPPTAWARRDPSLGVHPCEVGLTLEEQASVTKAVDVSIRTEVFQETVYAQPVVSAAAVGSHALIEGARGRRRLQSVLESAAPAEAQFLDTGSHWGGPELVQLEDTPNGWELVHYRAPWSERADGARTDGLVRDVIMTSADGLVSPTRILATTSPYTNELDPSTNSSGAAYMVAVLDPGAAGGGFLCLGLGAWSFDSLFESSGEYPVEWQAFPIDHWVDDPHAPSNAQLWDLDVYSRSGHHGPDFPVGYDPVQATDHLVFYFSNGIRIATLSQSANTPGTANLKIDNIAYPVAASQADMPRLAHLDWTNPTPGDDLSWRIFRAVFIQSKEDNAGRFVFTTHEPDGPNHTSFVGFIWEDKHVLMVRYEWPTQWRMVENTTTFGTQPAGTSLLHYSTLSHVCELYSVSDSTKRIYVVKLGIIDGRVVLFAISDGGFQLAAHFPLGLPDISAYGAAPGKMTSLSGGVSKFGGFRYVASDENGNVFLFRQRRLEGFNGPYAPPIYGFSDAEGTSRTFYPIDIFDDDPALSDPNSSLSYLENWVSASNPDGTSQKPNLLASFDILLNAALAFGTDESDVRQASWLGNTYQVAYAPRRFRGDSAHVVVERAQGGAENDYTAYLTFCNPVTKTWRSREIAGQVLAQDPGLNESGDHYQATVTAVNAYGRPVSLSSSDNAGVLVEVRADVETTVVDDTHNLYHDVDRYSSFMSAPDTATGKLSLLVKAESFAQVIYARLVDTSALVPSPSDAALLTTTGTTYAWQAANMAAEAQQRMGNDGSATVVDQLGAVAPVADTAVYVSDDALAASSSENSWQYKANFAPSSPSNFGSIASYLNTSGQNLVTASNDLGLAEATNGIDPLTAVTSTSGVSAAALTAATTFSFPAGSVQAGSLSSSRRQRLRREQRQLGSVWSSLSHALHDALHWLQHVEGEVYNELAEGAVALETSVDAVRATVSADIMKAVNGVDQALDQVVSTVEEYGSIVANLVVTIVEQSFLYKMIKDLIALISLFAHLKAIRSLAGSLHDRFDAIMAGPAQVPADYSSWEVFQSYFGPANDLADQMDDLDVSSVATEVTTDVLDAISKNPMTGKVLNKFLSSLAKAIEDDLPSPPFSFTPNDAIVDEVIDDITTLESDIVTAVEKLTGDVIGDAIAQMAADVANPQKTYANLTAGLETLVAQVEVDVLEPILDWADDVARSVPATLQAAIDQDPLISIDLTLLKDLFHLFGIGKKVNDSYTISAADAVFIPMAIVMWEALYTTTGRSISSLDDLGSSSSAPRPGPFGVSATQTDLAIANLAVNFVSTEMAAGVWFLNADKRVKGEQPPNLGLFGAATALLNLIRRISNVVEFVDQNARSDGSIPPSQAVGLGFAYLQLFLSGVNLYTVLSSKNLGGGWPTAPKPSDMFSLVGTLSTVAMIAYSVLETGNNDPSEGDIISVTGQSLGRSQGVAMFCWNYLLGVDGELLPLYLSYVAASPYGWILQAGAVSGSLGAPGGGHGRCPHSNGRGKGRGADPRVRPGRRRRKRPNS